MPHRNKYILLIGSSSLALVCNDFENFYLLNRQEAMYSNLKITLVVWFSAVQLILDSTPLPWSEIWIYDYLWVSICISIAVD